jgi:hypothetical protein
MSWCDDDDGDVGTTNYPSGNLGSFAKYLNKSKNPNRKLILKEIKEFESRELKYLLNKGRV